MKEHPPFKHGYEFIWIPSEDTQRRIDQINKHLPNPIQIDQVP